MKIKFRGTSMKLITAASAMIALAAIWGASRVGAVNHRGGSAGNPAAAMAVGVERTDLDVYALNANGTLAGKINGREWQTPIIGYNIVRAFRNSDGQTLLFVLNGNTGATMTFALNADGSIGGLMSGSGSPRKELRCNAAEFGKIGGLTKLITQDSFTGMIRTFTINNNGALDLNSMTENFLADMQDKNLFSVYENQISLLQSGFQMIGVNTWTGETTIYSLDMKKIASPRWTRGWTSIDHLKIGDATYRLLYKAAGDPYKKPGESGDEARRFRIEIVSSDGSSQVIYDKPLYADGGDISSVRFVQFPGLLRGVSNYGILFYKRTTSDYSIFEFDTQTGLGNKIDSGKLKEDSASDVNAPPYIDVAPYLLNGKTCLAFVSPDNAKPLGFEAAENMGRTIHDGLTGRTVGYQFILAQSGRIFFSRAGGKAKLDHDPAAEIDMTIRKQLELASVSKMITTMTVLKLAEQGKLMPDLSDKVAVRIDPLDRGPASWTWRASVLNLLTHASGMTKNNKQCVTDEGNLTLDCREFFNATPDSDPGCGIDANGKFNCDYSYNNSNTRAARKVIEFLTSAPNAKVDDAKDIVAQTLKLWADSVDLDEMTCKVAPNSYYYGPCDGAGDCFNYAGKSWRREYVEPEWLALCSSGHWYASSREMIEFLAAIRYRKALNQKLTDLLLSTGLKDIDGDATAVGWGPPWDADGEKNLGKGGYFPSNGTAARSFITRLPNNCDAVIQLNTETGVSPDTLLKEAYKNAALGLVGYNANDEYNSPLADTASKTFINTVKTGANESEHVTVARGVNGSLNLKAFRAARQFDGNLTLVAEKTFSATFPAYTSDQVAITDGVNFATASLGLANQLNLITWEFNGANLTPHRTALGSQAKEVAAAKVASSGSQGRIVTAICNMNFKLQLDVWDFNNLAGAPQYSSVTHKDSIVLDRYPEAIAIKNLGAVGDLSKAARFVVAYGTNNGIAPLAVEVWQVNAGGQLEFKDLKSFTSGPYVSVDSSIPNRVAIDAVGDGDGKFFDGHGFMTTFIRASRKLQVVTWRVDDAGIITFRDNKETSGDVGTQDVSATTTVVTLTDKRVKLIKWLVDDDGIITRANNDRILGDQATHVAATGNLLAAVQIFPFTTLKVANWTILK